MKILRVKDSKEGLNFAKETLYREVNQKTVLFMSGGKTPKPLYEEISKEKKLRCAAVAMTDDRYSMHFENSNEIMFKDSGIISYFEKSNISFYPILKKGLNRSQTAREYDDTVRFLLGHFKKSVAILGIGADGHIAGILPGAKISEDLYVADFNFPDAEFPERVSLTFTTFSKFSLLIVLVFGEEKENALKLMVKKGSIEKIPARFLTQKNISGKTILITNQKP